MIVLFTGYILRRASFLVIIRDYQSGSGKIGGQNGTVASLGAILYFDDTNLLYCIVHLDMTDEEFVQLQASVNDWVYLVQASSSYIN